jgi:hypothetical protein
MTINRSLVGVACAAVLVSPLLSLSSGRSIARGTVRVAAATCAQTGVPQYLVIDSRGSGESYPPSPNTPKLDSELHKWPGGLENTSLHDASPPGEAFAAKLQKLYPGSVVAVLGNPYPAVSVAGWPVLLKTTGIGAFVNGVGALFHIGKLGAYTGSVHDGTQWLERTVQQEVASCPSTKIILTGFSQGAQATADFYQRDITAAEKSHVAGVVLFGDPYFNPADKQVDRGTASATVLGFHGLLGKRRLFGNSNAKILSYCEMWDPICDADPNKEAWLAQLALFNKVHTRSYPTDGTKAALNFQTAPLLILRASTADSATASLYELAAGTSHVQLVTSGVVSAALTPDGALYVTRPTGQGAASCDLYSGSTDKLVLSWQDVSVPVDRLRGLCRISTDGAGGVLFEADDGTVASIAVWDFNPGTRQVNIVADGFSPTAAEGGTPTATVYHGYYAAGGSYDIPYAGPLGGPQHPLAAVPARAAEVDWEAPALSWNGRLFAAQFSKRQSVSVVLAHLSSPSDSVTGAITTLWRLPADCYVGQLFFGADGVLYGVVDNSRLGLVPDASSLYRIALSGSGPTLVAKDVDMIVSARRSSLPRPVTARP